jgi:hypothetical protein
MKCVAKKHLTQIGMILGVFALLILPTLAGSDELSAAKIATDQELNEIRGGFVSDQGLQIAIGIERAVYINGVLDTASTINFSTINGTGIPQASIASTALSNSALNLIQLGGNNTFSPNSISGNLIPGGLTVIQNSLDRQLIQNMTVINAAVTNLNLFRNMNLTSMINSQLIHSLR